MNVKWFHGVKHPERTRVDTCFNLLHGRSGGHGKVSVVRRIIDKVVFRFGEP